MHHVVEDPYYEKNDTDLDNLEEFCRVIGRLDRFRRRAMRRQAHDNPGIIEPYFDYHLYLRDSEKDEVEKLMDGASDYINRLLYNSDKNIVTVMLAMGNFLYFTEGGNDSWNDLVVDTAPWDDFLSTTHAHRMRTYNLINHTYEWDEVNSPVRGLIAAVNEPNTRFEDAILLFKLSMN